MKCKIALQRYHDFEFGEKDISVGIDLGTKTGVAVMVDGVFSDVQEADFTKSFEADEVEGFKDAQSFFELLAIAYNGATFVFEDVMRWSGSAAAKRYCSLRTLLLLAVPSATHVPIRTVKTAVGNAGNCKKSEMIAWALRTEPRIDETQFSDNQADAMAIAYWAHRKLRGM